MRSRQLDQRAAHTAVDPEALRAKAQQDRERLHTFTATPASETLAAMRDQVRAYLNGLPPVAEGQWLFGARISGADVVLAVLLAYDSGSVERHSASTKAQGWVISSSLLSIMLLKPCVCSLRNRPIVTAEASTGSKT